MRPNIRPSATWYYILSGVAALIAVPILPINRFQLGALTQTLIFAVYGLGWNFQWYSGLVSLGGPFFFGLGSYVSVILALDIGLPVPLAIVTGAAVAAGVSLLIGPAIVRLPGWVFALITFGFGILALPVFGGSNQLTGGYVGLFFNPYLFDTPKGEYYVALSIMLISALALLLIKRSHFGLNLAGIREDSVAASALGINVNRSKVLAFAIGNFLVGIGGAFLTMTIGFIDTTVFNIDQGVTPIAGSVVGGLGTIGGPIVGTIVVMFVETFTQVGAGAIATPIRFILAGSILMAVILLVPRGLVPQVTGYLKHRGKDGGEGRLDPGKATQTGKSHLKEP